jgi:aspartate-semialdehyde dehydrogenase
MTDLVAAVVGATGAVGRTMVSVLEERDFPLSGLRLMASSRSAGRMVPTKWGEVEVEDLGQADPTGIDLALFSAGADRAREFAPEFVRAGAVVVDNSSAFRMDPETPLITVGVNDSAVSGHKGIIANPNCTTITLVMAAGPLHRLAGLTEVTVSSYQAVSGSGRRGIDELRRQQGLLEADPESLALGGWADPGGDLYVRPIGFNVLPFAGNASEDGYTDEEWKLVREPRKILDLPELMVEPTCVRVPVMAGHAVSASLFFERPVTVEEANTALAGAPGVSLWTDRVPTPLDAAGIDEALVGRVRPTLGRPGGINLWSVADNLRKGAALNAVQIAELFA